jgi:hypothetical protein
MRGRPNKCLVVLGVNALARETGLPKSTISERMRKGQTVDQIREYAAIRAGRSPQRTSRPVAPHRNPCKSTETRREYEVILRGHERLEAIADLRLRRVTALAIKEELEIHRLRRELVPTAYVRIWSTRLLAYSKAALSKVVDLSGSLAGESDPVRCNQILGSWVERTLAEIAGLDELWGATSEDQLRSA